MNAGCSAPSRKAGDSTGACRLGRPAGIGPMTGAPGNQSTAASVPAIRAASGAGSDLRTLRGQKKATASATAPTMSASAFRSAAAAGQARMAATGPPETTGAPSSGRT